MHLERATAVMNAVALLPDDLGPDIVEDAEQLLVEEATRYDAKHLRYLGNHLVEVAAPEVAEAHTARLLEKQERDANADARFVMCDDGHGRVHGKFTIPTLAGAALKKALHAIAAPKHRAAVHGGLLEQKPTPERLGRAFADYVLPFPTNKLPQLGGMNATLVVTMTRAGGAFQHRVARFRDRTSSFLNHRRRPDFVLPQPPDPARPPDPGG